MNLTFPVVGHDVGVEHIVDLDELASRLQPVMAEWRKVARVGPLTWRDEKSAWPQPISSDRCSVKVPESMGLRVERGGDVIAVCVWTGGWADIDWIEDGEGNSLCPEFRDVGGAYAAVVENIQGLLA